MAARGHRLPAGIAGVLAVPVGPGPVRWRGGARAGRGWRQSAAGTTDLPSTTDQRARRGLLRRLTACCVDVRETRAVGAACGATRAPWRGSARRLGRRVSRRSLESVVDPPTVTCGPWVERGPRRRRMRLRAGGECEVWAQSSSSRVGMHIPGRRHGASRKRSGSAAREVAGRGGPIVPAAVRDVGAPCGLRGADARAGGFPNVPSGPEGRQPKVAAQVWGPRTPSTRRPRAAWKSRAAAADCGP